MHVYVVFAIIPRHPIRYRSEEAMCKNLLCLQCRGSLWFLLLLFDINLILVLAKDILVFRDHVMSSSKVEETSKALIESRLRAKNFCASKRESHIFFTTLYIICPNIPWPLWKTVEKRREGSHRVTSWK